MERLRRMASPTRQDLEAAARRYFGALAEELDHPRGFDPDYFDHEIGMNVEASRERIQQIDGQLIDNGFSESHQQFALEILREAGLPPGELDERLRITAAQLVARAVREQMQLLVHQLTTPASPFAPHDALFAASDVPRLPITGGHRKTPVGGRGDDHSLAFRIENYLARKKLAVGTSQLTETALALRWLQEAAGPDTDVFSISKEFLIGFRDNLWRVDVRFRGRDTPFPHRLTADEVHQTKVATATRHWNSLQAFFAFESSEGPLADDPAAMLKPIKRKRERVQVPIQ